MTLLANHKRENQMTDLLVLLDHCYCLHWRLPDDNYDHTHAKSTWKYEQQLILIDFALPKFEGIAKKESNPNKASVDVKMVSLPLHSSAGSCLNRPRLCLCRHGERPAQCTDRMLAGRSCRIFWNVPALRTSLNTVTDLFRHTRILSSTARIKLV